MQCVSREGQPVGKAGLAFHVGSEIPADISHARFSMAGLDVS